MAALLLLPPFCFAQAQRKLTLKAQIPLEADTPEKFVPKGWKIEEQLQGDLNRDSLADYALKLIEDKREKESDDMPTERQRALVVVLQKEGGRLARAAVV